MAVTPTINVPQGQVMAAYKSTATAIRIPAGQVVTVYNVPAKGVTATEAMVMAPVEATPTQIRATQGNVLVVARGRVDNFNSRAWTFTIDDHDFYVLQLGKQGTLVYDLLTQQWMTWDSFNRDIPNWRANTGCQWESVPAGFGQTDALAGDDTTGMLWFLDNDQQYDGDGRDLTNAVQVPFNRVLTGGLPARGRGNIQCSYVFLSGSDGENLPGSTVTLDVSDDLGKSWSTGGTLVLNDDPMQDITWFSLGSFGAPGRIFRVTDTGMVRIDSLDMK